MAQRIKQYQVDAFTDQVFSGNPAAVCLLDEWLPDDVLQNIAAENNLSETAYLVKTANGYHIRWFTPGTEVELCGHATLASAYVVFEKLGHTENTVTFESQSGMLVVEKTNEGYKMDFPVWDTEAAAPDTRINEALGITPLELYHAPDWVCVASSEAEIKSLTPNFSKLAEIKEARGIIVTALSDDPEIDFVSRAFFPAIDIDEDPVTGSAHCAIGPLWAEKLGKNKLTGRQISARSGDVLCEIKDDRVHLTGQATLFMEGEIYV